MWLKNSDVVEPLLPGLSFNQEQLFFINYGQVWCGKYKHIFLQQAAQLDTHSINEYRFNL